MGAGDVEGMRRNFGAGLGLFTAAGIGLAIAGELALHPVLHRLDMPADVYPLAADYARISFASLPVTLLFISIMLALRGIGAPFYPVCSRRQTFVLDSPGGGPQYQADGDNPPAGAGWRTRRSDEGCMQIGVTLRLMGDSATRDIVGACARRAEQAGFDALWLPDHMAIPPDDAEGSNGRYLDILGLSGGRVAARSRV